MQKSIIEKPFLEFTDKGRTYYASQPKQSQFHRTIAERQYTGVVNTLYGGSAKSGKSHALRFEAHNQCLSNYHIRGLLLRSSFPELKRTHLAKLKFDLPSGVAHYNGQSHELTYNQTGSILEFGYGKNMRDLEQYLSAEYDFIMIDELTTTPFELSLLLMSRLAATNINYIPFFAAATNPGSISHRQVKSYYIAKDFLDKFPELAEEYHPDRINFIQAWIHDNPALIEKDPGILDRLKSLPKLERMRFYEGNWDIFEGQFFYNFYRPIHVIKPFEIPDHWYQVNTFDFGNTCASHHLAIDPDGNVFVTHEWKVVKYELRDIVRAWMNSFILPYNLGQYQTIGDTDLFAVHKLLDMPDPPVKKFNAALKSNRCKRIIPAVKKSNVESKSYREYCNWHVRDLLNYLRDDNGLFITRPKLFIFEHCKYITETLPALITDPNNDNDIITKPKQDDHAYDSIKMGIVKLKPKPDEDKKQMEVNAGVIAKTEEEILEEVL